jgi:lipopolysaccharide transport system ATP-binding protein
MTAFIKVKNVCLDVPTFEQQQPQGASWTRTLLGAVVARQKRQFRRLLEDITFTLTDGDRLALIGRNGAGKSTLLRVLTGAYVPTEGVLKVNGTRQALLNIKLGFNKQATLVENIYLRGTAMGIPTRRVRELVGPVLEFAGLEEKARDRLYTLSSGQRMRLGFAIATAVSQDIILMDEWLGAGDAAFVERARERMNDRVSGSKIVVLASHNSRLVKRICNKGMLLRDGRIQYFGDIEEALYTYKREVKAARKLRKVEGKALVERIDRAGTAVVEPTADRPAEVQPAVTASEPTTAKPRRKAKKSKASAKAENPRKRSEGGKRKRGAKSDKAGAPRSKGGRKNKEAGSDKPAPAPSTKSGKGTTAGGQDGAAAERGKG